MKKINRFIFACYIIIIGLLAITQPLVANIKEAKKAYSQRRYTKALKLFQKHVANHPSDGEAFMYMGYIYEYKKNYPLSTRMFQIAADRRLKTKKKLTAYLKIILFYKYVQRWNTVIHYANRYLKIRGSKNIQKIRALAYRKRDSSSHVRPPSYTHHKKNTQKTPKKTHHVASIHKKSAKKAKPNKTKQKTAYHKPKTKEHYTQKTKKQNKKTIPKKIVKKKEKPTTIPSLENYLKINPDDKESRWQLSLLYLKKEFNKEAEKQLAILIESDSQNALYYYKLGIAQLRQKKYSKSEIHLKQALKLADEKKEEKLHYYAHLNLGHVYQKTNQVQKAIDEYQFAYTIQKSITPRIALSHLYFANQDYRSSIMISNSVLRELPKNEDALMYKSLSFLKRENEDAGYPVLLKFARVIKEQYHSKKIPPQYSEGLLHLANYYANRRKYKLAAHYIDTINWKYKSNRDFLFLKGKVDYYRQEYKSSIQSLEKVQDIAAACYLLAKSYAKLNQYEKVLEFLNKSGKLEPNYWTKAKFDLDFEEYFINPEFVDFLEKSGKQLNLASSQNKSIEKTKAKESSNSPAGRTGDKK